VKCANRIRRSFASVVVRISENTVNVETPSFKDSTAPKADQLQLRSCPAIEQHPAGFAGPLKVEEAQ